MLVLAMISGCGKSGSASLKAVSLNVVFLGVDAVVIEVRNATTEDIVLLSPEQPARQADEEQCVAMISTKVTDEVRPYAFTPALETVEAGSARRFRAVLTPLALPANVCKEWTINAEYAYVRPADVTAYKNRAFDEFRQTVLHNQKVISTTAKMQLALPGHPSGR